MTPGCCTRRRFDGVLFDLLTALLDSWSLWNAVAGGAEPGRRWRAEYLQRTYRTGAYRPYEDMVAEAAEAVGVCAVWPRRSPAATATCSPGPTCPPHSAGWLQPACGLAS